MRKAALLLALFLAGCSALSTIHRRTAIGGRSPEPSLTPDQVLTCALQNVRTPDTVITRLDTLPTYKPDSAGKADSVLADTTAKTRTKESAMARALDAACRSPVVKAPMPLSTRTPPPTSRSGKTSRIGG